MKTNKKKTWENPKVKSLSVRKETASGGTNGTETGQSHKRNAGT
jgi:hypothetical protein